MRVNSFSFVIPVYNRPEEIKELLDSFLELEYDEDFEIVIVEDGSSKDCLHVVKQYQSLNIAYYRKENSGPGASRNFGMLKAKGQYFIILDSDVILPKNYLKEVARELDTNYVDYFGGPDAAHPSFSNLQKAINFSMTSILTTGGIRGGKRKVSTFQPRSFNMGISKSAFEASNGFGTIHPGEDPDLSLRLKKRGFKSRLFPKAFVYHKRRISWSKFYKQVYKFGLVRPILNKWHPESKSLVYWFPTLFILGVLFSIICLVFGFWIPILSCFIYFIIAFVLSLNVNKSFSIALLSTIAIMVQFYGYGYGFLKSTIAVSWFNTNPKETFPMLFFNDK